MKKIFLSLGIILSLGLVGCGNKQNAEKIAEQEAKIEELKKKVSTIESDTVESASEEITPLTDDEKKKLLINLS